MKEILIIIAIILASFIAIIPFVYHINYIEKQNEIIIMKTDSVLQLTKKLEKHIEK